MKKLKNKDMPKILKSVINFTIIFRSLIIMQQNIDRLDQILLRIFLLGTIPSIFTRIRNLLILPPVPLPVPVPPPIPRLPLLTLPPQSPFPFALKISLILLTAQGGILMRLLFYWGKGFWGVEIGGGFWGARGGCG